MFLKSTLFPEKIQIHLWLNDSEKCQAVFFAIFLLKRFMYWPSSKFIMNLKTGKFIIGFISHRKRLQQIFIILGSRKFRSESSDYHFFQMISNSLEFPTKIFFQKRKSVVKLDVFERRIIRKCYHPFLKNKFVKLNESS